MIGGIKIYPRRWFGFGLAYRRHLNQQDMDHFNPVDFNIPIQQVTNVNVVGRGLVVVPGTSRPVPRRDSRLGSISSEEPNGFIAQFWVGRRNARMPIHINQRPGCCIGYAIESPHPAAVPAAGLRPRAARRLATKSRW